MRAVQKIRARASKLRSPVPRFAAALAIYILFFSDAAPHNFKTTGHRCYSPNGEYFTVRLVTPWRSMWREYLDGHGTGELYTREGVRLHSQKAIITADVMMATTWQDDPPAASMWGVDQEVWHFKLPTSPGKPTAGRSCY